MARGDGEPEQEQRQGKQEQDEEQEQGKATEKPAPAVIHHVIRQEGEHELERPASALAWSGVAAGLSMGLSLVAPGVLHAGLPDRPWRPLVTSLGYTLGFLVVILGRQQLFTENTLTPVLPLLENRDAKTLGRVLRLWAIVFAANLSGVLAFAFVAARTSMFRPELKDAFAALAHEQLSNGVGEAFLRAIVSGWIIALLVWVLPATEGGGRVLVIMVLTYLVGAGGFAHVVAGSVEVGYAAAAGLTSWTHAAFGYVLPVLVGNVVGGSSLVAALAHAQVKADADKQEQGS